MQPSWDDLRFVLLLSRYGTLSSVGREMGINQSTASRRLKALEKQVGQPLFSLRDRRYHATSTGKRWIQVGSRMERALVSTPWEAPGVDGRVIRVTALEFLVNTLLLPNWKRIQPDGAVRVEFDTSVETFDLKRTPFDFALRLARPAHLGPLRIRKLAEVSFGRIGPRGADERKLKWVELREELQQLPEQRMGARFREGREVLRVSSYQSVLRAIEEGEYSGILPLTYLRQSDRVKRLGPVKSVVKRELWLLMKEDYLADPVLRRFHDRICEFFRKSGQVLG